MTDMLLKADLYMDGRARIASYRSMLESLLETGLPSLTHREAWHRQAPEDRYLCVRHDVDHNLEIALQMARIEHDLGVRASYYLLPPGDYDKNENYYGVLNGSRVIQSGRLREVAQEIAALGHEIGLHNDFLQLSRRLGRPLAELISEQIAYFRGAGVEVTGSASHGSRFARAHSYVNYEVFKECQRPNSQARAVSFEDGSAFEMFSIEMASLGLDYEAYNLLRDVYISDTGSRLFIGGEHYGSLQPTMMSDLVGTKAKVIALVHPEWWKPLDPAKEHPFLAVPRSTVVEGSADGDVAGIDEGVNFQRADRKPYRIGVRGDCCSRRAVVMNKHLFPRGVELIINEKCPNVCFVDSLNGLGSTLEFGETVSDVPAMAGSLKHYYIGQFDRSVLQATDLDLLMVDSYSDMNFELWRHRQDGRRLWMHPKFIRNETIFKQDFEKIGYVTLDQAVEALCAVIDHVRLNNPDLPVMVLNQPVEYYPKLDKRRDFYELGQRLAAARPGVFAAKPLALEQLVPADLGSCGPGFTLHFDADTYHRMIVDAWDQGLGEQVRQRRRAPVVPVAAPAALPPALAEPPAQVPQVAPQPASQPLQSGPAAVPTAAVALLAQAVAAPVPSVAADGLPVVQLSYGQGRASCVASCPAQVDAAFKTYAQYFRHPEIEAGGPAPRFTPMLIATDEIRDFAAWEAHIKTFGNGARLRQKRKAIGQGFYAKMFPWKQFIPDIHDVNHSKASRSGGAMRGSYLRSVEEMGGAPERRHSVVLPTCVNHWSLQFGTFVAAPGHAQGTVVVDERLLAYISLRRCGDVVLYSQIMGHGDYLNRGALVLLHHEVIRWISEQRDGLTQGLRYVMYGGVQNGGESLLQFKRQAGFRPHHVLAYRAAIPAPQSSPELLETEHA